MNDINDLEGHDDPPPIGFGPVTLVIVVSVLFLLALSLSL